MSNLDKKHLSYDEQNAESWRINRLYTKYLYSKFAYNGCYVPLDSKKDELCTSVQKQGGDVVYTSKTTGESVFVDEKADTHQPVNLCLEVASNTSVTPWTPGWIQTSKANKLINSFTYLEKDHGVVDTFVVTLPRLQRLFWSFEGHKPWYEKYPSYRVPDTSNHTYSRIVPIKDICDAGVTMWRYIVTQDGEVQEIPIDANALDYIKDGHIILPRNDKIILLRSNGVAS